MEDDNINKDTNEDRCHGTGAMATERMYLRSL